MEGPKYLESYLFLEAAQSEFSKNETFSNFLICSDVISNIEKGLLKESQEGKAYKPSQSLIRVIIDGLQDKHFWIKKIYAYLYLSIKVYHEDLAEMPPFFRITESITTRRHELEQLYNTCGDRLLQLIYDREPLVLDSDVEYVKMWFSSKYSRIQDAVRKIHNERRRNAR